MLLTVSVYGREGKGTGGEDTADARFSTLESDGQSLVAPRILQTIKCAS